MKKKYIYILLVFAIQALNAQTDSLLNQILNSETRLSLISKGRDLLLDKFVEGDLKKVKELDDYLSDKLADENYIALFLDEQCLIKFWTQDYDGLIVIIKNYDSLYLNSCKKIRPYVYDDLYKIIRSKTFFNKSNLIYSIKNAAMSDEDKDYVLLYFYYCLLPKYEHYYYDPLFITQDTLNILADNFLNKYSKSKYKENIKQQIRVKYEPIYGFGLNIFCGYATYSDQLNKNFKSFSTSGVSMDLYYKSFFISLGKYSGVTKIKDSILYNGITWLKDSKANIDILEASLGYQFTYNKYFFTPFIGIASHEIKLASDKEKFPQYENIHYKSKFNFSIGFNFDRNISFFKSSMVYYQRQIYYPIRLRYECNIPHFEKTYTGLKGNLHTITLGVGLVCKRFKRVY